MSRVLLGVNIDHIATVRNARGGDTPSPIDAALIAEAHGADGITAHLREDRRHIRDEDIRALSRSIATHLNFEMAVTDEMVSIACEVRPSHCCLVPEKREELTTEGGLDVLGHQAKIQAAVERLSAAGIDVSLFVDPDPAQLEAAVAVGAPTVELHTGAYAEGRESIDVLAQGVSHARALGLVVNAWHGLDLSNVGPVARLPGIHELNIGYSIVARALFVGLDRAVAEMREAIDRA